MPTCMRGHSWFLQSPYQDQALQISLRGIEGLEVELEGCLGEGQSFVFYFESVRRVVGKKNGCFRESKESP